MSESTITEEQPEVRPAQIDTQEPEGGQLRAIPVQPGSQRTLELDRDCWIFPVLIEEEGEEFEIRVRMATYTPKECRDLFERMGITMQIRDDNTVFMQAADATKCKPFFWAHFLGLEGIARPVLLSEDGESVERDLTDAEYQDYLDGVLADAEDRIGERALTGKEQKQWISDNPGKRIEEAVVLQGYGKLMIDVKVSSGAKRSSRLLVGSQRRNVMRAHCFEFNSDTDQMDRVDLRFVGSKETEHDLRQYSRATGGSELHRQRETLQRIEDHAVLEQIGRRLLCRVDGYMVDGQPCVEENKSDWIDLVPYWHLNAFVDYVFARGAKAKNA